MDAGIARLPRGFLRGHALAPRGQDLGTQHQLGLGLGRSCGRQLSVRCFNKARSGRRERRPRLPDIRRQLSIQAWLRPQQPERGRRHAERQHYRNATRASPRTPRAILQAPPALLLTPVDPRLGQGALNEQGGVAIRVYEAFRKFWVRAGHGSAALLDDYRETQARRLTGKTLSFRDGR
jgi:hypothetical protein